MSEGWESSLSDKWVEPQGNRFRSNGVNFPKFKLFACMPEFCVYPPWKGFGKCSSTFQEKTDEQKRNGQLEKEVFIGK